MYKKCADFRIILSCLILFTAICLPRESRSADIVIIKESGKAIPTVIAQDEQENVVNSRNHNNIRNSFQNPLSQREQSLNRYRATEKKLLEQYQPPPPRALDENDIKTIVEKTIAEKEEAAKNAKNSKNATNKTNSESTNESPFGKIGGVGPVGGIGAVRDIGN